MSNIEKVKESSLGLLGSTPTKRDHQGSTVHVKNDESTGDLTLSWSADKTSHDLKGVTVKRYDPVFDLPSDT